MNTKDIILFGVGAFAGYLLVGYFNKNKVISGATDTLSNEPKLFGLVSSSSITDEIKSQIKKCQEENDYRIKATEYPVGTDISEVKKQADIRCVNLTIELDKNNREYALANQNKAV